MSYQPVKKVKTRNDEITYGMRLSILVGTIIALIIFVIMFKPMVIEFYTTFHELVVFFENLPR